MEYKLSDGTVLTPGMQIICKDTVSMQGFILTAGCVMHVVDNYNPSHVYVSVKIDTMALSSSLMSDVGLNIHSIDFYIKEGKMEIVKRPNSPKKDKIVDVIVKQLGVNRDAVKDETTLIDLGVDDLDSVELAMALEGAFNITISEEDWPVCGAIDTFTVKQVRELVNRKLQEKK